MSYYPFSKSLTELGVTPSSEEEKQQSIRVAKHALDIMKE